MHQQLKQRQILYSNLLKLKNYKENLQLQLLSQDNHQEANTLLDKFQEAED